MDSIRLSYILFHLQHGGKDQCKHPGCTRARLKSREDWCYTHYRHLEKYREQRASERAAGLPALQCTYFEMAAGDRCSETAIFRQGLCPDHFNFR